MTMKLLQVIGIILLVLWFAGFMMHFGGAFIHILLVVAVILLLLKLIKKLV